MIPKRPYHISLITNKARNCETKESIKIVEAVRQEVIEKMKKEKMLKTAQKFFTKPVIEEVPKGRNHSQGRLKREMLSTQSVKSFILSSTNQGKRDKKCSFMF